jgi:hypothetical protein
MPNLWEPGVRRRGTYGRVARTRLDRSFLDRASDRPESVRVTEAYEPDLRSVAPWDPPGRKPGGDGAEEA